MLIESVPFLWQILLLTAFGIPVTVYDIKYYRIPDSLVFGGLAAVLIAYIIYFKAFPTGFFINAAAGFLLYFVVWLISGKKLGWGDIKYSAFLSALAGFFVWLEANCLAAIFAMLYYVIFKKFRKKIPYAPFMTAGVVVFIILRNFFYRYMIF